MARPHAAALHRITGNEMAISRKGSQNEFFVHVCRMGGPRTVFIGASPLHPSNISEESRKFHSRRVRSTTQNR